MTSQPRRSNSRFVPDAVYRALRRRTPGYYVINPRSGLPVAGPFEDHAPAQREAARRNAEPPLAPDPLEVRRVGPDRVWP